MKHKTWFRLVIKAIGVLFVGMSIPTVAAGIANLNSMFSSRSFSGYVQALMVQAVWLCGSFLQLALGLYLFFGGKWIVDRAIPSNRPYCPECGYDLSKSNGTVCPECGVTLPRAPHQ
jgi:hypothetical protein